MSDTCIYTQRKNLILCDVIEVRKVPIIQSDNAAGESNNDSEISTEEDGTKYWYVERKLSQAMVPGSRLVKVEVSKEIWDETVGVK
eukprot:14231018-Ditylum_brightwellii.AAC.1